jgi:uncharacterized protein (DUF427 family)
MRATWNGATIAESDDTVVVEGNHYFPADAIKPGHLRESSHTSRCGWKGTAAYFDVLAGDEVNANAAWVYREPLEAAASIRGRIAFWKGVTVQP